MRYCLLGRHQVTPDECREGNREFACCNMCRARRRAVLDARNIVPDADDLVEDEPDPEGLEPAEEDEYDTIFGDGADFMDIDVPDDSAISARQAALLKKFDEALSAIRLEVCDTCDEQRFDMNLINGECQTCRNDKHNVKLKSAANNVSPGESTYIWRQASPNKQIALHVPPCLRGLTEMEELICARVMPVMQVRYTRGRQLSYKEHIVNFHQDISVLAAKLPRLPQDVDMVIIRRDGVDLEHHVDFMVRREKVRNALEYKIIHDPGYAGLQLDMDALEQLPEQGSVAHLIPTCREGRQDGIADPAGPEDAAANENVENGADTGNEQHIAGLLNIAPRRTEAEEVHDAAGAIAHYPHYEQQVIVS